MQRIARYLYWVSISLSAIGWFYVVGLGIECMYSPPSRENPMIACAAGGITMLKLALVPATALSTLAYLWLSTSQRNIAFISTIAPCLLILTLI
jgi:hypothetical protein